MTVVVSPPIPMHKAVCRQCARQRGVENELTNISTTRRCVYCQTASSSVLFSYIGHRRRLCHNCADTTDVAGRPVQREAKSEEAPCAICNRTTMWIAVGVFPKSQHDDPHFNPTQKKKEETPTMKFPLTFSVNTIETIDGFKGQLLLGTEAMFFRDEENKKSDLKIVFETPAFDTDQEAALEVVEHIEGLLHG